ncbi:hypothetical protein ACFLY2_03395 [Patescibacteria group bacterium]
MGWKALLALVGAFLLMSVSGSGDKIIALIGVVLVLPLVISFTIASIKEKAVDEYKNNTP